MEETALSFEQILNATVRLLRTTWQASACLFLQADDDGQIRVRASDGVDAAVAKSLALKPNDPLLTQCMTKNEIVESKALSAKDNLARALGMNSLKGMKYVLVPVSGQARVLGVLVLGPFPKDREIMSRESELRSAGALCAVLSAHWRLYEWISNFLPQVNHELRTPLTAIQGSIGMVLGGVFGQVGGEVKAMLEMAHKGCERTVRAIEDYLTNQELPKK